MRLWFAIGTLMIALGVGGCAAHTHRQASTLGPRADGADRKMAETCNEKGLARVQRGDWAEAERWFRQGIGNDPGFAAVRNNLALVLLRRGEFQNAAVELKRANVIEPWAGAPKHNLARIRRAHTCERKLEPAYTQDALSRAEGE